MRQAEGIAKRRGHPALTRQIILRLERGQIKHPDADALQGVAAIYDVAYPEIAAKFFAANYGSDLMRPGSLVEQGGNKTDATGVLDMPDQSESQEVARAAQPRLSAEDINTEIIEAAAAFGELELVAAGWRQRLLNIVADGGAKRVSEQAAMARPGIPASRKNIHPNDRRQAGRRRSS